MSLRSADNAGRTSNGWRRSIFCPSLPHAQLFAISGTLQDSHQYRTFFTGGSRNTLN